ncbi:MAG: L-glutamate gamma-semialdehyde dehydrogenase [Planctomycetota bacterium]
MSDANFRVPPAINEPVLDYAPGTQPRIDLEAAVKATRSEVVEVPIVIGGKEIRTGDTFDVVCPHDHGHVIAKVHKAKAEHVQQAADACRAAVDDWERMPWEHRVSIFLRAAEMLAGPRRMQMNAATMCGQSKTANQAEIDSACELIDFFRFNCEFLREMHEEQPESSPGMWNRVEYRGLEGFVFAVTPFNFTAIAGNLPTAPAMVGNTAIWKPSETSMLSSWRVMQLLQDAGLPDGVINFVPGDGPTIGDAALAHEDLTGLHFTGSTRVFQHLWQSIGNNLTNYRNYPRIVGETGGKDFVFAHPSAEVAPLCTALVRGAFEFQGQKCSAASRAYIPSSVWSSLESELVEQARSIKMGPVEDFSNFMSAVIDKRAFDKIKGYIDFAKESSEAEILVGGECDDSVGYFVQPTVIKTSNPNFKTMVEEIFGPVLTIFVYDDQDLEATLDSCNTASAYALTGAIFAKDRHAVVHLANRLRHAAGNFYINDKPTGAVVGQQPFGGGRASGTNDKAGSRMNLLRWTSVRTIKETFVPPTDYRHPYMG